MAFQSEMAAQQVRSQRLQNDMLEFDLAHQLQNWQMNIDLKDSQRGLNDANAGLARAHDFISRMKMPSEVALNETAALLNTQNAVLSRLNQRHQDMINKYLPQDKLYEYQDLAARAFLNSNLGRLNLWLAKNTELSYNQAKDLNEAYVRSMKAVYEENYEKSSYGQDYWHSHKKFVHENSLMDYMNNKFNTFYNLLKPTIEMSRASAPGWFGTSVLLGGDDSLVNQAYHFDPVGFYNGQGVKK